MRLQIKHLVFLTALILLFACTKETSQDIQDENQDAPDEVFFDFVTQETDSGRAKWKLTAPKASKFNTKNLVVLEKPVIRFFDEEGKLQTTLTSDNGELYKESQDMLAYGHVLVRSVSGDFLETDSLYWMDAKSKIRSDSFVKLTRGNDIVTGIGMECNYKLSAVKIKKNIQATIIDEGNEINE